MYAALDLGQKTVRAVLKRQDGKIVNELKIKKQAESVLKFHLQSPLSIYVNVAYIDITTRSLDSDNSNSVFRNSNLNLKIANNS
jgi:hypothetical protein